MIQFKMIPARSVHNSSTLLKRQLKSVLSLDEFIFRKEVISLYRQIARTVYKTHQRKELMEFAKTEFASQRHVEDMQQRKYLVHQGKRQFETMAQSLGISHV